MKVLTSFVFAMAFGSGLSPAWAANAEAGRALAKQWCAGCHGVEPGAGANDTAPSFVVIAGKTPGRNGWIRAWLNDPHPPMRGVSLSRRQIEDVISYLETLSSAQQ